jgi:hypothetical protein
MSVPTQRPLPRLRNATDVVRWAQQLVEELQTWLYQITTTVSVWTMPEQTTTPPPPTDGAEARLYLKADKLIVQFNDGGTVRWKYLDLTGTGTTWTHTASAP